MFILEILIYIRKPGNIWRMVLFPASGLFGQSWIKINSDGYLKVYISQKAYEFLDPPGSYNDFCKAIAQIIDDSISFYVAGEKKKALKIMGIPA